MLIGPMRMLGSTLGSAQRATAAGVRIFELLDRAPRIEAAPDAQPLPDGGGEVVFEHVDFRFPTSDRADPQRHRPDGPGGRDDRDRRRHRLGQDDARLACLRGSTTSIAGAITVDGVDVRTLDPVELRRNIAFVAEDSFLFSASIADNIAYARDDVDRRGDPSRPPSAPRSATSSTRCPTATTP